MKYKFIYLTLIVFLVGSCKKQLDIKPENIFTENMVISGPGTAESLLADVYFKTYQASVGTTINGMSYLLGDASTNIVSLMGLSSYSALINGTVLPNDPAVANIWNSYYSAINEANIIINQLASQSWSPQLRNKFIAEAKFLRAYNYFMLLRLFGDGALNGQMEKLGVPLRLENFQGYNPNENIQRNKNGEVYAQIFKDLKDASNVLNNSETDNLKIRSRAQQSTCYALASRVALCMGDYDKTIAFSDSLLQSTSKYGLMANPKLVFPDNSTLSVNTGEPINKEMIFVFPVSYNINTTDKHNIGYFYKAINWPNADFISKYETVDIRKAMFIQGNVPNPTTAGRVCPVKFSAGSSLNPQAIMRDNIAIIRLSEIYLNKAEALVRKGGVSQSAVELLNTIHERAGNAPFTIDFFPSADSLLHSILRERRMEFAYEGMDRYDQIRNANLDNLPPDLGIKNLNSALINPQKWILPIPINDVVLSQGRIRQNSGY